MIGQIFMPRASFEMKFLDTKSTNMAFKSVNGNNLMCATRQSSGEIQEFTSILDRTQKAQLLRGNDLSRESSSSMITSKR